MVAAALQHSLALDPGAMSIIYGDYDAPPPSDAQLAALEPILARLATRSVED